MKGTVNMNHPEPVSLRDMLDRANAEVTAITATEAIARAEDDDFLLIDLRDSRELAREGRITGALHCPRGMLEFWIDPDSPYHKRAFARADTTFAFFCAGGLRSALGAKTAQDMGLAPVVHIEGGYDAWRRTGGPVQIGE